MSVALLHRRLTAAMALSALLAFMAGAGMSPEALLSAGVLCFAALRLPPESWAVWIERGSRIIILALCAWMLYVAFVVGGDFLPAVMAMLLFLLAAETLRPLQARNDTRLYLLSFALLLAATAYYPGVGFAASFVAFVLFATLAMTAGYLRRQAERFRVADVRLGRRMMLTVGALSGVVLLVSASLFVLFPRLPRQWNVQGRGGGGGVMAGFSDEVRLGQHGGRIADNPEVAFRVEFMDSVPAGEQYWRGRSFDRFDGERWTSTRRLPGLPAVRGYGRPWVLPLRQMLIFGGPPEANVLFGLHPVLTVQARSAIRVWQHPSGDVYYSGSDEPVYAVISAGGRPSDEELRALDERPDPAAARAYLQMPPLEGRVQRLADSLTAGHGARIDRVRAIERYLSTELRYTLELPRTASQATVEGFLFDRRAGHCEYFSTAMVMLLRAAGIPSRNVTGFLGGEWNSYGGYLAVTGNDAHSWAEAWFPGLGWVPFDPTPPARDSYMGDGAGGRWGISLWFGAVEHRWYKWVVDYNLEKQLGMFSRVGELFSRDDPRGGGGTRGGRTGGAPRAVAVIVALGVLGGLLVSLRRRRAAPRTEETRAYLALRRACGRAGLGGTGGPLQFAERLAAEDAPGAAPAGELVRLYVRARFGQEDIGEAGRARMRAALDEARRALRDARRERRGGARGPAGRAGGSGGSARSTEAKEKGVLVGR